MFFLLSFIQFVDGSENFFMTILVQILKKEWNLNSIQIELLGSLYYIGLFCGAIVAGFACDYYGRRKTTQFGNFVTLITVIWTAFAQNFIQMCIIRALYGFVVGFTIPIGLIISTEICPKEIRGRTLIIIESAHLLGKFYLIFLCFIFLKSLEEGNWRGIAVCQLIPIFIMTLGCLIYMEESPRYLLAQNRLEESIKVINKIGKMNHNQNWVNITENEIEKLQNWQIQAFQNIKKASFFDLFKGYNLSITWRLSVANSNTQFLVAGCSFIIPFIFHSEGFGLIDFFYATLGEIPASFVVYALIDTQKVGRLKIIQLSLFLCCLSTLFIYFFQEKILVFGLAGLLFFSRFTTLASAPLIGESYDTLYRSMGLGFCAAMGRSIGSLAPFVVYEVFLWNKWSVFLIFTGCIFATLIMFVMYPGEKTNSNLDAGQIDENQNNIKNK
ncbi:major facilitator superfamily protein, putative [Ichthyophthirius multifiliis]|uniref:Major facilitator superfamily protein, putative n=1 Tax=Ichthyophthirius multifiliis TaxID=5932 RepID=G0QS41_ICHMU|nr:major facilitator superfamily protein, putative [Ichthyophthirius multifiliis]EGR31954.1 major facilitator superfamily protein, putative [Ichthyophthirius multifiliis]|eukprot:XP_004035440.1 major facilitator superfamily protein, putative [Ichthyophthirius multifiliis]